MRCLTNILYTKLKQLWSTNVYSNVGTQPLFSPALHEILIVTIALNILYLNHLFHRRKVEPSELLHSN